MTRSWHPRMGLGQAGAGQGEADGEVGAAALGVGGGDGAAVGGHHGGDDGEAEAGAAGGPRPRRIAAVEPLEDPGPLLGGDARAGVGDGELGPAAAVGDVERQRHRRPRRRVGAGVGQQVADHLAEAGLVADHRHGIVGLDS